MSANPNYFAPRFQVGDSVTVTLMGPHQGKEGVVTQIIEHKGDYVYRYRVGFAGGNSATFFAFELKLTPL